MTGRNAAPALKSRSTSKPKKSLRDSGNRNIIRTPNLESRSDFLLSLVDRHWKCRFLFLTLLVLLSAPLRAQRAAQQIPPAPFFLHDGDTLVFYGDSVTEQNRYTRDIETWTLVHHADWHVRFINSGWNSDTAEGGKGGPIDVRLKRDVLPYRPTVVTILLGTNDAGYHAFKDADFQAYTLGMTHILDTLTRALPGVRLILLTPTFYDEFAPGSHHIKGYNALMQRYGDAVKTLAEARGLTAIDLNAPLRAATVEGRKTSRRFTLVPDGVHPSEAGHLIIAATILRAWNAPADVPTAAVGPRLPQILTLPPPWPLPGAALAALAVSPDTAALVGMRLQSPPDDPVPASRRREVTVGAAQPVFLAPGTADPADLTGFPTLPPNAQAQAVLDSVQERLDTWRSLWKGGPHALARQSDTPTDAQIDALLALDRWLDARRDASRALAVPQAHTWVVRVLPPRSGH